jgi:hypothetical protein
LERLDRLHCRNVLGEECLVARAEQELLVDAPPEKL